MARIPASKADRPAGVLASSSSQGYRIRLIIRAVIIIAP
jgi:hypothetical protein